MSQPEFRISVSGHDLVRETRFNFPHRTLGNWSKYVKPHFQTLNNRQCRTGVHEGREINEVSLPYAQDYCMEIVSRTQHRKATVTGSAGLADLRRQTLGCRCQACQDLWDRVLDRRRPALPQCHNHKNPLQ